MPRRIPRSRPDHARDPSWMVTEKMSEMLNRMPDALGRRDRRRHPVRTQRGPEGVPGGPLRAGPDGQGREDGGEGARAQGRRVRVVGRRTPPAAGGVGPGRRRSTCTWPGVSTSRVDDVGQAPWGGRMPSRTCRTG